MSRSAILISARAKAQLARLVSPAERLAIHIVSLAGKTGDDKWLLGLTPESQFFEASAEVQNEIVAGRSDGVLVVVDTAGRAASTLRINIDTTDDGTGFRVTIV